MVSITVGQDTVDSYLNGRNSPPIYANIPIVSTIQLNKCPPPVPDKSVDPNRILLDHWSEYTHLSGRKYYYNSVTKQSSWKPPRRLPIFRDEEESSSHSEENLTDTSSTNSWSLKSNNNLDNTRRNDLSSSISSNLSCSQNSNILSHRTKSKSRPRRPVLGNIWKNQSDRENLNTPPPAYKTGFLNRTKISENGKRIRKNWCSSWVALTSHHLLLYKESKVNTSHEVSTRPEIVVELVGSQIEWSKGLSSRRHVFQLTTALGNQILFQEDCSFTAAEWFCSIKSAISKLPKWDRKQHLFMETISSESGKECKLKRSKSTKQQINKKSENTPKSLSEAGTDEKISSAKKQKIRERLINFLRGRPSLDSLREKGIFRDEPVFGCDLQSLCAREKQLVPKVVQQCIKAIESKGLKVDGIYRVCGNLSEVQKIRYQVNHDNYDGIWAQEDIHVLTGALKLFFRDMKDPLFPCNRFNSLMHTVGMADKREKHDAIVKVVRDLPKCNKETLKFLLKHLLRVHRYRDENRMTLQNLAIVFGPTLLWPETDSNNLEHDMMLKMHSNQVIELLLLEFDNIFK